MDRVWRLVLCVGLVICVGCGGSGADDESNEPLIPHADAAEVPGVNLSGPATTSSNTSSETAKQVGPFEKKFDGITFSIPDGWREVDPAPGQGGFIDARFLVPSGDVELELTMSSIGGGLEPNVARWMGQFDLKTGESPGIETISAGTVEGRWLALFGTFKGRSSGRPGPHADWGMLGVGIPMQPRDFYLKLNGPADAVKAVEDAFRKFVQSAQLGSP